MSFRKCSNCPLIKEISVVLICCLRDRTMTVDEFYFSFESKTEEKVN